MNEKKDVNESVKPRVVVEGDSTKVFEQPVNNSKSPIPGETSQDQQLPVLSRIRKRLTVLKKKSSAVTTKIPRGSRHIHRTVQPEFFIVNLEPVLSNKDYGTISYGVYKQNKDGSKFIEEQYAEVDGKKRLVNAGPVLYKTIVEYFEFRKPGYIEVFLDGGD